MSVIDLHCHVLPGIDDGPGTLEDSLELARASAAAGITTIVATPHVAYEYPDVTAPLIAERVAVVREALRHAGIDVEVVPGAEIGLTRALDLTDDELHDLYLGGGGWVLIEAPLSVSARQVPALFGLTAKRGHRIVIAHPERSPAFQREPRAVAELVQAGMLCQITASSLTGAYGRPARDLAIALVSDGLVHVVASDAHDAERRPPSIAAELELAGFAEQTPALAGSAPASILVGQRPSPGVPTHRRGRPHRPTVLRRAGLRAGRLRPSGG
jgi:protein-tyrosine phosphatase